MKIGKLKSKKIFYALFAALLAPVAFTSCHDNLDVSEDNGGVVENKEGTYVTVSLSGVGQNKPSSPKQIGRPAPTRINYTLDGTSTKPVPKFDMKVGDVIKVAAVFVNSENSDAKTIVQLPATLTSVSDKDFTFVCEKKIELNTGDVHKGTWYYMGIIGGEFDKDHNRVKFKTETNLRPFSRAKANQKLSIESPFTTDWVEMKVAKNEKGENVLRTAAKNKTITYKARGVILVMSMANETQMDVKINRTFTLVTNNLTTNGYYDLDAAGNGFKAEDKSYKLWKTAETPASEYYSAKQKNLGVLGGMEDSYRTTFKFLKGQITLPDGTTVDCTDDSKPGENSTEYMYFNKVKQGGEGEHIKLNRYYLAWVMPKTVGYNYSIMLGSAECTERARTKTTSTLPAELADKGYSSLPNPATWKPDMSSIAIGGFAKKMSDADDGKVFRLDMSLVRPMLPIERVMPNYHDTKYYSDAGESKILYQYFRSPYLNEIGPITNTPMSILTPGQFKDYTQPWGSHRYFKYSLKVDTEYFWDESGSPMAGNGVVNTANGRAYSIQNLIGKEGNSKAPPSTDYTAAYYIQQYNRDDYRRGRLIYKALYLGPHFTANYVTLFLVGNPGFWGEDEPNKEPFFGRKATDAMTITRNIIDHKRTAYNFWLSNSDVTYITKKTDGSWAHVTSSSTNGKCYILPYLNTPSWGPRIKVVQ